MRELSRVMPSDVWLTNLSGAAAGGDDELASDITGPSLSLSGCADGHEAVARFLAALEDIDGVTRVGISKSELGDAEFRLGRKRIGRHAAAPTAGFATSSASSTSSSRSTTPSPAIPPEAAPVDPGAAAAPAATSAATPEQQQATDSAAEQTGKAKKAANLIPGVQR